MRRRKPKAPHPLDALFPTIRGLGVIYLGFSDGKPYVGKTFHLKKRLRAHVNLCSGPCRGGRAASWAVLAANVPAEYIDSEEAYFIGLYNALSGWNTALPLDYSALKRGKRDRAAMRSLEIVNQDSALICTA